MDVIPPERYPLHLQVVLPANEDDYTSGTHGPRFQSLLPMAFPPAIAHLAPPRLRCCKSEPLARIKT